MNKLNWPTAFVIVVIIFAGAFVYNTPIDARKNSDSWKRALLQNIPVVFHPRLGSFRWCSPSSSDKPLKCSPWSDYLIS